MSHPARGPILGIDGKAIAATGRSSAACIQTLAAEASRMSHPARRPTTMGIDGKATAVEHRKFMPTGRLSRQWAPLIFFAAMAGCQTTQDIPVSREPPRYQIAVEQPHKDIVRALKYYEQLLNMKPPELVGELDKKRHSFEQDRSDFNRLQLAMLLSLPGTDFRDDSAAIELLQNLANDRKGDNSSLRPLALLLYAGLAELRRADETLQQQATRLKEEQRRADALQSKLEALLELEMRMIEREQASQPKSR